MNLLTKAYWVRNSMRLLGAISLLFLIVWTSYGLSTGAVYAAQGEAAAADTAEETSDQEAAGEEAKSDDQAESDKQTETKEEKSPDREGKEEKSDSSEQPEPDKTEQPTDQEQPGDKEAEEEDERPIEEEPNLEEGKPKEKQSQEKKAPPKKKKCIIGATATLMEKQSEILFRARVDSGAKSCSLHVESIKIDKEGETMADNIGKVIRFQVNNGEGKKHWLESKISGYVIIKTSSSRARRYKVPLTFQWKHMEKKVLVTLNNRNSMEYPLLLGRNFLRGDFLVDVELDSDD